MSQKRKKSKEQIINDFENRFALTCLSGAVLVVGIILAIILSEDSNRLIQVITLFSAFILANIIGLFAIRCPICDRFKHYDYFDVSIFRIKTGFYRCEDCNLSNKQIREYVDLLRRGVDIDKNTIARFNKREL